MDPFMRYLTYLSPCFVVKSLQIGTFSNAGYTEPYVKRLKSAFLVVLRLKSGYPEQGSLFVFLKGTQD